VTANHERALGRDAEGEIQRFSDSEQGVESRHCLSGFPPSKGRLLYPQPFGHLALGEPGIDAGLDESAAEFELWPQSLTSLPESGIARFPFGYVFSPFHHFSLSR
jgi:hypothetical protein